MYTIFVYQNYNDTEFSGIAGLFFTKWGACRKMRKLVKDSFFMYRASIYYDKDFTGAIHLSKDLGDYDFFIWITKVPLRKWHYMLGRGNYLCADNFGRHIF